MAIDFSPERWDRVRDVYRRWWDGKLGRPIIPITLTARDAGRAQPATPLLSQATCHDLSWSAEQLIDRIDWELSQRVFLGDAFPFFNLDCFGPGVIAAFMGGRLDNSTGQVWFYPPRELEINDIHFEFNADNRWFRRVKDIYTAGMKRWKGQVLMGMTDLGGNLDMLSTFRPGEQLLLDLYDQPEQVKRLTWEAHEAWHAYYKELNEVLQPTNPGYSDWSGIYSDRPGYMLQCDFCYMIGPEMFDEFVKQELTASCRRLGHRFYHLDGMGQLPHLDSLLTIKELEGVQWIPGAGQPKCEAWPDVHRKIQAAGKKTQIFGDFETLDKVIQHTGDGSWIHASIGPGKLGADTVTVRERLGRYGISP